MSERREERKREILDWDDLRVDAGLASQGRLTELEDVCVEIDLSTLKIERFRDREVAIVTVRRKDRSERRHTFSEVIIRQLKMAKELYPDAVVTARVTKVKRYYQLTGCGRKP
ncbi:MAG: hypothetical protein LM564_02000 [Desulfurococcaceae archaeon]|nr:hypothetical protein [Desulfurococcaceae archaeon]